MTRRRIAVLLAAMVALSGVLPLGVLAAVGLQIVSARGERASQEALQAIAEQAAARIESYVSLQRQMLRAHAPELTAAVDEDCLEVGRLPTLDGAAELRRHLPPRFSRHRLGEMAAEPLCVRGPGGSFRRRVHVQEPAVYVVQARRNHQAVNQPQVDVLQGVGHGAPIVDQPFTMRQQGR